MNKEQKKILLKKLLPKFIILFLVVAGCISFLVMMNSNRNAKAEIDEFRKNGGSQTIDVVSGKYDSIIIDKLIIKYPNKYQIADKYGNEEVGGGYTFIKDFPKDELSISFSPKEIIEGVPSSITSINVAMNNLEKEIVKSVVDATKKNPDVSENKLKNIGDFEVNIREIKYDQTAYYIYGIESEKYYLIFTSHLKLFLKAIIENIKEIN